jgi:hypothetical protein
MRQGFFFVVLGCAAYVSGFQADPTAAALYRIDIRPAERKQMASWRRSARVNQAWIAYSSGRIFVATTSPDPEKGTLQVGIDCFDAGSGGRLWEKTYDSKANALDLKNPISRFTTQKDSLTYSIGPERWTGSCKRWFRLTAGNATGGNGTYVGAAWRKSRSGDRSEHGQGRRPARHALAAVQLPNPNRPPLRIHRRRSRLRHERAVVSSAIPA